MKTEPIIEQIHIINYRIFDEEKVMKNKLVIDGNAVYEIDEDCMRKRNDEEKKNKENKNENFKRKRAR